ncbi:MAG: hypothetical protein J6B43_10710 [Lachnospiraceae bacterium]|nr:hypothetical protein [Lachnospiraceae bacterium]
MEQVQMEQLQEFWTDSRKEKYEKAMNQVIAMICEMDAEYAKKNGYHFIRFIEKRLKTPESIWGKINRKNKEVSFAEIETCISDLAGIRIICFDIEQVYEAICMIRASKKFSVLQVKDYIRKPKDNGYQSFHMLLSVDDLKIEVQLRTILMDAWSSLDSILIYKKKEPISKELQADIHKFAKWSRKMDKLVHRMLKRR